RLFALSRFRTLAVEGQAPAVVPVQALENPADRLAWAQGSLVVWDQSFQAMAPEYRAAPDWCQVDCSFVPLLNPCSGNGFSRALQAKRWLKPSSNPLHYHHSFLRLERPHRDLLCPHKDLFGTPLSNAATASPAPATAALVITGCSEACV